MRYLSKRDDFLRSSKINEKNDFIRKSKSGLQAYELIKEDGGPFYNTVGWNDSLLGRLVNHLIRKAKVALGKARIKPVLNRLYAEFDRIAAEGVLLKADEVTRLEAYKLVLSEYIAEINKAVEDGDDHSEISGLTEATIKFLNDDNELLDEEDFPEKTTITQELEEFKKLLLTFGDGEKTTDDEETEEVDKEEVEEETPSNIDSLYPSMVENLKALSSILKLSNNSQKTQSIKNTNTTAEKPLTNAPDVIKQIADSYIFEAVDLKKEIEDLKNALEQAKKNPKVNKDQIDMLTVSIQNKEKQLAKTPTTNTNVESKDSLNVKSAIEKLKMSLRNLSDPKIKVAVDSQLIDGILAQGDKYKDSVIRLYTEINRFLVGDRSKTLNYEPDKLYEDTNLILNKGVDQIAEKIAKFYKRALQFENGNLFTSIGDFKNPLKSFVETMKKIISVKAVAKPIIKKTEPVKTTERKLMGYENFFKMNELLDPNTAKEIEESDKKRDVENKEEEEKQAVDRNAQPGEVATGSTSEKIKDFWDKKCKTTRSYVIDKTEADKINANLEKINDSADNKENFIIDGLDPIINIVRLFNRAYKIYTVATITKRSGGKVDPKTFSEYTSYGGRQGGDDLNGWSGPFRNNKIFNIWEDGVLKILGDPKYQYIFSKTTKLRMPKVSNPSKQEDYEYRGNAGANLRKFMTDILDGEELYKISGGSTEKGSQAKFLAKYFGEPDEKTKVYTKDENGLFTLDREDGEENSKNAKAIDANSITLKFKKGIVNKNLKANQFFVVICKTIKDNGEESANTTYRFFQVVDISGNGNIYLSMCNSFFYFNGYLKDSPNSEQKEGEPVDGRKKTIEKGDLEKLITQSKFQTEDKKFRSYVMKYTTIKQEFINSLLTSGNEFEINYIDKDKKEENEKVKIISGYWLVDDKSLPYTAYLTKEYLAKKITGGSNSIKDVSTHLKNANIKGIKKI